MNTSMSNKSVRIIGAVLWICGVTLLAFTAIQVSNPVHTVFIGIGAGCVWFGTWVSTLANSASKVKGQSGDENSSPS